MSKGFRVWDKQNKEYINGYDVLLRYDGSVISRYALVTFDTDMPVNGIIEFDTGLKDKNGKKIYVGDIVQIAGERASIVFDEKLASYMGRFPAEYHNQKIETNDYIFAFCPNDIEVIGNVHQNRELLGDEK